MFALLQGARGEGLTLGELLRDVPHDGAAMFVYALVLVFIGLIWYGSRKKPT